MSWCPDLAAADPGGRPWLLTAGFALIAVGALLALGNGFSQAFIACAIAAAAGLLTPIGLHGVRDRQPDAEAFVDPALESACDTQTR